MLADQLSNLWNERRASGNVDATMRFSDEGLVLGVGTVLVAAGASGRDISIDPLEPTLSALLTAAHLRKPTSGSLTHLRKAAECWRGGQDARAYMHLVLSGLDRLERPDIDAQRLFLADGLLKAGFGADVIIGAVESDIPELYQLSKYSPDQPRVPAGSGRASGQWTSTSGDSSVGASSDTRSESAPSPGTANPPTSAAGANVSESLLDPPRPEVNPNTVTEAADQQYETPYACKVAHARCAEAAFVASAGDAANDNGPRNLDLNSCRDAAVACEVMSFAVQYYPLPIGGGVRFPHGGLVLIYKGRVDRYVPSRQGGQTPSLRRTLELGRKVSLQKVQSENGYSFPPWNQAPDEVAANCSAGFSVGEQVIEDFCSSISGEITEKTCSISEKWGKIVRSKIVFECSGSPRRALLTCWSESGSAVHFDLTFDCCGDCGKP